MKENENFGNDLRSVFDKKDKESMILEKIKIAEDAAQLMKDYQEYEQLCRSRGIVPKPKWEEEIFQKHYRILKTEFKFGASY